MAELTAIAGYDYWQSIIADYSKGIIDCYQAEKEFAKDVLNQSVSHMAGSM